MARVRSLGKVSPCVGSVFATRHELDRVLAGTLAINPTVMMKECSRSDTVSRHRVESPALTAPSRTQTTVSTRIIQAIVLAVSVVSSHALKAIPSVSPADGTASHGECPYSQLSGCYTQSTCADVAKKQRAKSYCYDPTVDPDWGVCIVVNCTHWCPNATAPVSEHVHSCVHTHTLSLTHTHTHTLQHTRTHMHTHTHTLTHSLTHSLAYAHIYTVRQNHVAT